MIEVFDRISLFQSLRIQLRVIHALIMREIITRYGRHNLGFAWLFVEPMIFTVGVAALWYFLKNNHGSDLEIVPFAIIGYSTVLMWRNVASRVDNSIQANTGLLYHRNVKVFDVFLSRILLEIFGATISFLVLSLACIMLGLMSIPDNFLRLLSGWLLLAWFATGLGLTMGPIFYLSEVIDRLWHAFTYLMFPLSGAAFFVYWLPEGFRQIVLYIPMVHFSEMIKHGYYGNLIPTFENIHYILWWNLILTFLGLYLVRFVSSRIDAS